MINHAGIVGGESKPKEIRNRLLPNPTRSNRSDTKTA